MLQKAQNGEKGKNTHKYTRYSTQHARQNIVNRTEQSFRRGQQTFVKQLVPETAVYNLKTHLVRFCENGISAALNYVPADSCLEAFLFDKLATELPQALYSHGIQRGSVQYQLTCAQPRHPSTLPMLKFGKVDYFYSTCFAHMITSAWRRTMCISSLSIQISIFPQNGASVVKQKCQNLSFYSASKKNSTCFECEKPNSIKY